jgi:hypothetical protein
MLAFILMSAPAFFSGAIAMLHGTAAIAARIEITDRELKLAVPKWRVFPILPVRRLTLRWDELLAVRHRKEVYHLIAIPFLSAFSFRIDVFAIDTTKGRVVLGGRSIPGMQRALMEIVRRAGLVIQDQGELKPRIIQSLLKGSPPWDGGGQEPSG